MALEVPRAFLSDRAPTRHRHHQPWHEPHHDEQRSFRLAPSHTQVLKDVARGVEESDVGVCCSYLIDHSSGEGADYDAHALNRLERFTESALSFDDITYVPIVSEWRARIQRCRRALARLRHASDHISANVLMVAYGYPDPLMRQLPDLDGLGLLASLVRYTDVVEHKRQELARAEAASHTRTAHVPPTRELGIERRGVDWSRDEVERQSGSERARAALSLGLDANQGNAGVIDLARHRQLLEWADRAISSADALRAALAPFCEALAPQGLAEPKPAFEARKEARKAREAAHKDKRATFVTQARIEVTRMISRAEKRYHDAWLRSAS